MRKGVKMAATRKTNTQQKSPVFENAVVEEKNNIPKSKKIDFDEKITVRNIAPWAVGWNKVESLGEVNINPYGSVRISRAEYIAGFDEMLRRKEQVNEFYDQLS